MVGGEKEGEGKGEVTRARDLKGRKEMGNC